MSTLKGAPEFRARLKAIKQAFKPIGKAWADATVIEARRRSDVDTGRQRRSFRVKNASQTRATVVGSFTATFQDSGVKPHLITPRRSDRLAWSRGGRTIFARQVNHPGRRAKPFKKAAASEGMRKAPMAQTLIDQWNRAA